MIEVRLELPLPAAGATACLDLATQARTLEHLDILTLVRSSCPAHPASLLSQAESSTERRAKRRRLSEALKIAPSLVLFTSFHHPVRILFTNFHILAPSLRARSRNPVSSPVAFQIANQNFASPCVPARRACHYASHAAQTDKQAVGQLVAWVAGLVRTSFAYSSTCQARSRSRPGNQNLKLRLLAPAFKLSVA